MSIGSEIIIPGLLLIGAAFTIGLYHLFLYLEYKERIILYYSLYLIFIAAYIAGYILAFYYVPDQPEHYLFYFKESLNIAAITGYGLFIFEATSAWRQKYPVIFRIFNIVTAAGIIYSVCIFIIGLLNFRPGVVNSHAPVIMRVLLLIPPVMAVPVLLPKMKDGFLQLIKWGGIFYLLAVVLIMITFFMSKENVLGLHHMEIFFIGTAIDIIFFSLAMGYRVRTVFTRVIELRNKISRDLHDEVGATLTSISLLSEVVKQQVGRDNSVAQENIGKIGEFSREMISEMNDIVWAINPVNDKFEKIEDRMYNFATTILATKNIHFDFNVDDQLRKDVLVNMQQRKNLYLIFKEAVTNAAKYANCTEVKVKVSREDHVIHLEVADDGIGLNGHLNEKIYGGNGLKNMQQRAMEINAKFQIESGKGKGTSISLSMPITKNAY